MQDSTGNDHRMGVLIVDQHPVTEHGLRRIIESISGVEVVAVLRKSADVLRTVDSICPDMVVMEMLLDGRNALELLRSIRKRNPGTKVLVVSMLPESIYAERALRAGALGYLSKSDSLGNLMFALGNIACNEIYMSACVQQKILRRLIQDDVPSSETTDILSDFELSVFELVGKGHDAEDIARLLDNKPAPVSACFRSIRRKLRISSDSRVVDTAKQWVLTHHC